MRHALSLALICLLQAGCASTNNAVLPPPVPVVTHVASAPERAESPFSLEVLEDANDGTQLHVHGQVQTRAAWALDDIVMRMSGGRQGESRTLSFYRLPALMSGQPVAKSGLLEPGRPWDFYLSVPSKGLSDYQLELLWGKEAKAALASEASIEEQGGRGLELQNIKIDRIVRSCLREPCPASYRISAQLFNASDTVVQSANLGVGFLWAPKGQKLDLVGRIPEDEEHVNVTGLNLQAKESRPLSLELDETVPSVDGGEYVPALRILSFQ